jgi:predicted enzyme related to lactoylglutathione lyase
VDSTLASVRRLGARQALRGAPRSHAEPASGHPVDQPNQPDPQVLGWHTDAMKIVSSDPVLAVHDLDRTSLWFTRVLGCERSDPDPGNWTFCRAGTVTFMLGRCPEVVPASELWDHSYVAYLSVEKVDDYHARAISEQAEVLKAPTDEPWGRREMGLRSPDGHRFMLGERIQQLSD